MIEIVVDEEGMHKLKGKHEMGHNSILITIDTKTESDQTKIRKWKKGDEKKWEEFNKTLHNLNLTTEEGDYNQLEQNITKALERTIGSHTISTAGKKFESEMIKEKRSSKQQRHKEFFNSIKYNNAEKKNETLKEYLKSQKELKQQIEKENTQEVRKMANKLIQEGGSKSNLFWKLHKRVVGKKSTNTYDMIDEEGNKIDDPEKAKEHIANFYENLYQARERKTRVSRLDK